MTELRAIWQGPEKDLEEPPQQPRDETSDNWTDSKVSSNLMGLYKTIKT